METKVVDNPDQNRYEISADGEPAGFAEYHLYESEIAFIHTEIDPKFGGQGMGGKLARGALDDVRRRGLGVLPYCPFIRGWIGKHADYLDLVPAEQRAKFEL